jgi:MFS family permease
MHKAIKILLLSSLFFNISAGAFGPIYAIFVEKIGGDLLTASTSWAIYSGVIGVLTIVFGKFETKWNQRKLIVLGYALEAFINLGYIFIRTPFHLVMLQAALGVVIAFHNPAWDSIFSKSIDKGKETEDWGYWEGSTRIIAGIGAIIGGAIVTVFGFRTLFLLMAADSAISAGFATLLLRKNTWKNFAKI